MMSEKKLNWKKVLFKEKKMSWGTSQAVFIGPLRWFLLGYRVMESLRAPFNLDTIFELV